MGGYLAIKRTIEVGEILSFIQYIRSFNQPVVQVAQISNVLQSTIAAAERVFEFLEEEEITEEPENAQVLEDVAGAVDFEHVRFGYDEDKIIIKDFTVSVKPGQKVAIVGPTGAGKTTIVKLLMRFYELNGERILIDGVDIKEMRRDKLRSMFVWFAKIRLFKGSIRRISGMDGWMLRMRKLLSCKGSTSRSFIRTLPNTYDMEMMKKRIIYLRAKTATIARAFLKI